MAASSSDGAFSPVALGAPDCVLPHGSASGARTQCGVTRASEDGGDTWENLSLAGGGNSIAADLVGNVFVSGYTTEGVSYKRPAPTP